jgi:hypothetical protein
MDDQPRHMRETTVYNAPARERRLRISPAALLPPVPDSAHPDAGRAVAAWIEES